MRFPLLLASHFCFALPGSLPAATVAGDRTPARPLSAARLLLTGGGALFAAAVAIAMALFELGLITPEASALLGALACVGMAGFHGGLAIGYLRERRRA